MKKRIIAFALSIFLTLFVVVPLVSDSMRFDSFCTEHIHSESYILFEDESTEENGALSNNDGDSQLPMPENTTTPSCNDEKNTIQEVPNVVGLEQLAAINILCEHGFSFQVYWDQDVQDHPSEQYYIVYQDKYFAERGEVIHLKLKQL